MAATISVKNDNQYKFVPPTRLVPCKIESYQPLKQKMNVNGAIMKGVVIEAKETYFVVRNIIKKITIPIIANSKEIEDIMPKLVAAPLPPLNLKNIGNIWPIITKIEIAWTYNPLKKIVFFSKIAPMKVNQNDFETSNKKIISPNFQP